MFRCIVLTVLVMAAPPVRAESLPGHPTPPPDVVAGLRQHHNRKQWFRVTTDDARYEVRVRRIDDAGLSGLTPRPKAPAPPDPLPWSAIARIDRRTSGFRGGQITGVIVGGLAGIIGANLVGLVEEHGELGVFTGLTLGAVAGGWIGGWRGDRRVREHPFYEAPAAPAPAALAVAPADSAAVATPADSMVAAPALMPPSAPSEISASPMVASACRRLDPEDLLRVEADFGRIQGYAAHISPAGLEGLRADLAQGATVSPPPLVTWDHIHHVDKRGNSAGAFALRGGLALGVLGGVAGLAAAGGLGGNDAETMGGGLAGAAIGGATGAALGGLIGLGVPRWHIVY